MNFKKTKKWMLGLFIVLSLGLVACAVNELTDKQGKEANLAASGNLEPTRQSPPYEKPADADSYTIMVYLNGSDLESEDGSATDDLNEMLAAARIYPTDEINVVVQTGGTKRWYTKGIPPRKIGRYLVTESGLEEIEELPLANMGSSDTLTDFINFAMDKYPADRFGLVLWNHGGGAVSGFGVDELFDEDGMTLQELKIAFDQSYLKTYPLEFLGFDACLMANAEAAYLAQEYATYLVASQELEPGYGWDYKAWLTALGKDPSMDGATLGQAIVDSFIGFYIQNDMREEPTTLSVVDLSKMDAVVAALEDLISVSDLSEATFQSMAKPRSKAREFGLPTEYGGYTDMVDMVHLATQYQASYPVYAANLIAAVEKAVVYQMNGPYVDDAGGLSLYFPYHETQELAELLAIYQTCGFSPSYIDYVTEFASLLTGEAFSSLDVSAESPLQGGEEDFLITIPKEELSNIDEIYFTAWILEEGDFFTQIYEDSYVEIAEDGTILTEFDGVMTTIDGELACLYEIESGDGYIRYGVPAVLNGEDVNLILLFDDKHPDGIVQGAMPVYDETTGMAPKNWIPIESGDEIALVYYTEKFYEIDDLTEGSEDDYWWSEGPDFVVGGDGLLVESWEVDEGIYLYGFTIIDLQGNEYYTDFIEVEYQ